MKRIAYVVILSCLLLTATNRQVNADSDNIELPIIMYHSVLKSAHSKYCVTPKQLENDIIALKKEGYEPILPSELLAYVDGKGSIPEKPVMITFDDGHYNNYHYGMPLFEKYDFKALINIVGLYTNNTTVSGDHSNPNYSHLTYSQIAEMSKSGYFEIGNHTYNLHNLAPRYGISQLPCEDDERYRNILTNDLALLQETLTKESGVTPICFAYPFGKFTASSKKIIMDMGFKMIFNCSEKVNKIKQGDYNTLLRLQRINRDSNYSTSKLISKIQST